MAFQPMMIFYRGTAPLQLLSQLKGKRLVIGAPGSGDRSLAMTLLELNGISNNASATSWIWTPPPPPRLLAKALSMPFS